MSHPKTTLLEAFMHGELSRAEAAGLVRHLLTGCPRCAEVTRRLWALGEGSRALRTLLEEMLTLESGGTGRRLGSRRASLF
jgi:hypothetical protein